MNRQNLNTLRLLDRRRLARLIRQYATPSVVNEHWSAVADGIHRSPTRFLSFHRDYIKGLEDYLSARGFTEWVPLPYWNPAEPIPPEFNYPSTGSGRLLNLSPNVSFSPAFDPENLGNFRTEADLGMALMPRHNRVHRAIGGIMNNQRLAPAAPIFWPFHSFVDDIWWQWQSLQAAAEKQIHPSSRDSC